MKDKAHIVVLSAPSGAGKSTICKHLVERNDHFQISVSATTRSPRPYETDGVHYFFLDRADFVTRMENDEFLETEEIHGNIYGTLKAKITELLEKGITVLFDIGVYGALNVKEIFPESILIFVKPPAIPELRKRLLDRQADTPEQIEHRLTRLPLEMEKAHLFDHNVINDDLNRAIVEIEAIISDAK